MAKNAQFYLLNPEKKITVEQLACDLAAQAWRLGKRVLIACLNATLEQQDHRQVAQLLSSFLDLRDKIVRFLP